MGGGVLIRRWRTGISTPTSTDSSVEQARQGRVEAPSGRWVTSWGSDVIAAYAMVAGLVTFIAVLSAVDARRDDRLPVAEAVTVTANSP